MEIRRLCETDDLNKVGLIFCKSWQAAYRGIIDGEYLENLDPASWAKIPDIEGYQAFVLVENNEYIGITSVCPSRDEKRTGWGEIVAIYLLPEYFGKGLGKILIKTAIEALSKEYGNKIYLEALKDNHNARKFYLKQGFYLLDEENTIKIGEQNINMVKYEYAEN